MQNDRRFQAFFCNGVNEEEHKSGKKLLEKAAKADLWFDCIRRGERVKAIINFIRRMHFKHQKTRNHQINNNF